MQRLEVSGAVRRMYGSLGVKRLIWTSLLKVKGKAIPLQAWTGPEGSRKLRLPDFKTFGTKRW